MTIVCKCNWKRTIKARGIENSENCLVEWCWNGEQTDSTSDGIEKRKYKREQLSWVAKANHIRQAKKKQNNKKKHEYWTTFRRLSFATAKKEKRMRGKKCTKYINRIRQNELWFQYKTIKERKKNFAISFVSHCTFCQKSSSNMKIILKLNKHADIEGEENEKRIHSTHTEQRWKMKMKKKAKIWLKSLFFDGCCCCCCLLLLFDSKQIPMWTIGCRASFSEALWMYI